MYINMKFRHPKIRKCKNNNYLGKWHAIILIFYVVSVVMIPLTNIGSKGTRWNTIIKFIILLIVTVHFFCTKKRKLKLNFPSLLNIVICLSYVFGQSVLFLIHRDIASYINALTTLVIMILCLVIIPRIDMGKKALCNIYFLFVCFILVSCLYNLIIHADRIISLSFLHTIYYDMFSFFDNKNTYGIYLFAGLAANVYLLTQNNRKRYKLSFLIILFSIVLSLSRTSLISSMLFLVFGYALIALRKKSKMLNIILFMVIIVLTILSIDSMRNYILEILIRKDVSSYRGPIYEADFTLFKQSPIFGYGENAFGEALKKLCGNEYTHNGYFTIMLSGGLIYFIGYFGIILQSLLTAWKIRKYELKLGSFIFSFVAVCLVYATSESIIFVSPSATNFSITLFAIIVPKIILNNIDTKKYTL